MHTQTYTLTHTHIHPYTGLPGAASGKEHGCNAGDVRDLGSVPGSGRPPGGGHSNPPPYSCLENPTDRGAWRATVHGVTESWTRLSDLASQQAQPYTDRHSCNTHTCTHMYHSRMHTFTHSCVHTDTLTLHSHPTSLSHIHTPHHHQRLLTDSRNCAQNRTSAHRSPPHACRRRRSHKDTHAHSPTRPARTPQREDKVRPGLSTRESRSLSVLPLVPPRAVWLKGKCGPSLGFWAEPRTTVEKPASDRRARLCKAPLPTSVLLPLDLSPSPSLSSPESLLPTPRTPCESPPSCLSLPSPCWSSPSASRPHL